MTDQKVITAVFVVVILAVFGVSFASAGIGGWFNKFTGRVTDEPVNVSITIVGTNPVTIEVFNGTLPTAVVTNDGFTKMTFYVVVDDTDGVNDINDTSVFALFKSSGEATRVNVSAANYCTLVGDLDSTSANYSCGIDIWYYDFAGTWDIEVNATDLGSGTVVVNVTQDFTVAQLQGIEVAPIGMTFSSVAPGATNVSASNNPLLINNTGNYGSTNLTVSAIDLWGTADTTKWLAAGNMTINNNTGNNAECSPNPLNAATNATRMVNGSIIQIIKGTLQRGNNSFNDNSTGQEILFYCFPLIPGTLPSDTYDTSAAGGWTLTQV